MNIYFKLMCDIQVEAISRCLKMMVWHLTRRSQLVLEVSVIHVSRNHKNRKKWPRKSVWNEHIRTKEGTLKVRALKGKEAAGVAEVEGMGEKGSTW